MGLFTIVSPPGLESLWDNKQMFRLGKTQSEAYRVWAERSEAQKHVKTIAELLERYIQEVAPDKAPKTFKENTRQATLLSRTFGKMFLEDIQPQHVYTYYDKRSAKVAARREIALLSHAYTKAVQWGYISAHPFKGEIRLEGEKPRTRYIEDWEIVECLSVPSVQKRGGVLAIQAYIRVKLLTGLRRGDLLRLRESCLTDEGIEVGTHKTGKPVVYEWSDELRGAISGALLCRPNNKTDFLFCNRSGMGYINEKTGEPSGWNSMWQRYMDRVLAETKVKERFTEHDLRAKCASDAETLDHARALLSHTDSKLTQRVYRRKAERVKPLR